MGTGKSALLAILQKPSDDVVELFGPQLLPEQLAGMIRSLVPWMVMIAIGRIGGWSSSKLE